MDKNKKLEKESSRKEKTGKEVETMFRVSLSNHQRLSDMADNKAHIMITVNSIILSAVLTILLRRLEDYTYLMLPAFLLVATALSAIILSILATRPTVSKGTFDLAALETGQVNLLFFGNFYKMPIKDYKDAMWFTMENKQLVYDNLIMDGYAQGVVLGKKYKLLRLSYTIFMIGLLISVLAFSLAVLVRI